MDLEANVEIGDFRIERRLGAGGMGVVYKARQKSLDRVVALKVLGSALAHPSDIVRFKREAQAAAKLKHPGIATIYYVGQDEQACYMAMDYIDGITLRQLIDRLGTTNNPHLGIETVLHESAVDSKPPRMRFDDLTVKETESNPDPNLVRRALEAITPEAGQLITSKSYIRRVCEMMREAAQALQHAHDRGVIHRDIKPQNIMLDRQGAVHVIDFGIARFFDGNFHTQTGALIGTPMYMSPEQVSGRINVDHRSDIYSLGLVMYEMLTLRRPIYAPTREAVLRGVVTKAMVPVSWKNNGVSRDVESVVHKAFAKDPDERYQHAADFADDVQRALEGQPVTAEPYRYKFDEREIVADRPWCVTTAAFWFYFISIFYGLISMPYQIGLALANPAGIAVFPASRLEYVLVIVGNLVLAGVACWVAQGLLAGLRRAQWVGLPIAVLGIGLSLSQPAEVLLNFLQYRDWGYLGLMSMWLVSRSVVALGGCGTVFVLLMDQSSKRWFRFSQQIRLEHDALATTDSTR